MSKGDVVSYLILLEPVIPRINVMVQFIILQHARKCLKCLLRGLNRNVVDRVTDFVLEDGRCRVSQQ